MGEEGDIKMLLNIPRVSSAKFRKTFHEAMNQARRKCIRNLLFALPLPFQGGEKSVGKETVFSSKDQRSFLSLIQKIHPLEKIEVNIDASDSSIENQDKIAKNT